MISQEEFQSLFPEAEVTRYESINHYGDLVYRIHFKFGDDIVAVQFRLTELEQAYFSDSEKEKTLKMVKRLVSDHQEREGK